MSTIDGAGISIRGPIAPLRPAAPASAPEAGQPAEERLRAPEARQDAFEGEAGWGQAVMGTAAIAPPPPAEVEPPVALEPPVDEPPPAEAPAEVEAPAEAARPDPRAQLEDKLAELSGLARGPKPNRGSPAWRALKDRAVGLSQEISALMREADLPPNARLETMKRAMDAWMKVQRYFDFPADTLASTGKR